MARVLSGIFLSIALLAAPSYAGTICGVVRDAYSLQPVSHAAVFLFDDVNEYIGLYAVTDAVGAYCIDGITAGTYSIQVRVDDYLVTVIHGIAVSDSAVGVDILLDPSLVLYHPWPNPASNQVMFRWIASQEEPITLEVFDLRGRLVKGWRGMAGGDRRINWDLCDRHGNEIASGVYLVRVRVQSTSILRHFVCLR